MGDLTPTAWQPLTLHCPRCGWHGHPLVAYTHPTHQRVNHRTIATLDVAWLEEAAS